jgi:hypothetical protein
MDMHVLLSSLSAYASSSRPLALCVKKMHVVGMH